MSYQERKAAKIERFKENAEKANTRAEGAYNRFKEIQDRIPLGQPILVGHHSEKSARADQKRLDNCIRKVVNETDKAKYWEGRAESLENRRAIDSDDPEAKEKILAKIKRLDESSAASVLFNKRLRAYGTWDKIKDFDESHPDYDLKVHVEKMRGLYAIPSPNLRSHYKNTSRYAQEKKRLLDRLAQLERSDKFEDFEVAGHSVTLNEGRYIVRCAFKPNETSRRILKTWPISLKWSPREKAWVRKIGPGTNKRFVEELKNALHNLKE